MSTAYLDEQEINETREERIRRKLKYPIQEAIIQNLENQLLKLEIKFETDRFLTLLCDIIAMDTLPNKTILITKTNKVEKRFTAKKLKKPLNKLQYEANGKTYHIANYIYSELHKLGLNFKFYRIQEACKNVNVQKKYSHNFIHTDNVAHIYSFKGL